MPLNNSHAKANKAFAAFSLYLSLGRGTVNRSGGKEVSKE